MENTQPKKRLSAEAVKVIKETSENVLKDELQKMKEDFSKLVAEQLFELKSNSKKKAIEEKIKLADYILKQYIPLKSEIENFKTTLINTNILEESDEIFFNNLMTSRYKNIKDISTDITVYYVGLYQLYKFLDNTINKYIQDLQKKNQYLEEVYEKNEGNTRLNRIVINENKIYILEKHYKEGIPVDKIKIDRYENERRFAYDKNELLSEISTYLTFIYAVLDTLE